MDQGKKTFFEEGQILLFDKPVYWTSFDLVNKVKSLIRKNLGIKKIKVGHAGTLDPLAGGLMIICTGNATKRISEFTEMDKEYIAAIHLGGTTPSFDLETETDSSYPTDHITRELVLETLMKFIGVQTQMPPMHSAKFIEGKRAYEFARKGVSKKLEPVTIFISEAELLSFEMPEVRIRLRCSKGTYIRAFARDFGAALNSGGYLSALQRTSIGPYKLSDALSLEKFEKIFKQM
ncbi:MAG: tRNA pseudouridine(55) synthase TruB [Bacteroidales bacterium]|nr:tRNA pseudouridine(55) synthase TruB [Bacteroidales bacterium]